MNREQKQKEAVESFEDRGIILAAPRFGKIRVALDILQTRGWGEVLVVVPRNDIMEGWVAEEHEWRGLLMSCTTRSIKNVLDRKYDAVILDEIHEYSDNQLDMVDGLVSKFPTIALTGTMTKTTENNIASRTGLTPCYRYSIEQAVEDGILTDYQIFIHTVDLDDKRAYKTTKKGRTYTENRWFDIQRYIPPKNTEDVRRIGIIQNSFSKRSKTLELLEQYKEDRILVFCGTIETADSLGIPVYHSGNKDEQVFKDFCEGKIPHCATIKMMQAGVTVNPIKRGIINYTSGNPEDAAQKICRFLGWEYDNPDKKADLHVVSCSEKFEKDRLKTALQFFNKDKIIYV